MWLLESEIQLESMSELAIPPSAPPTESALVASGSQGVPPIEEELPVDLMQIPSIPLKKSLLLLTNFCSNTVRFVNHFSNLCEDRLGTISKHITRIEISLAILEAKLNSIPDLPATASISAADIPPDLPVPESSIPPPPPPPPPIPSMDGMDPPPPPPPAVETESSGASLSILTLKDDPLYAKYFTMQRMGLPEGAIRQKMIMDGVDPEILSQDPEKPSPFANSSIEPVSANYLALSPPLPPSRMELISNDPFIASSNVNEPPPPPPTDFQSGPLPPVSAVLPPPAISLPSDVPPPPPIEESLPESLPPTLLPLSSHSSTETPEESSSLGFMKLKDDPMFSKYFTMRKLGMPDGAIRHKLNLDGVTLDILEMDPEGPSPNAIAVPPTIDDDDDF